MVVYLLIIILGLITSSKIIKQKTKEKARELVFDDLVPNQPTFSEGIDKYLSLCELHGQPPSMTEYAIKKYIEETVYETMKKQSIQKKKDTFFEMLDKKAKSLCLYTNILSLD